MRSSPVRVGPKSKASPFRRRENIDREGRHRDKRGDLVKIETEMGVIWPQATGHLEPQKLEEAGRTPAGPSPDRAGPHQHLDSSGFRS